MPTTPGSFIPRFAFWNPSTWAIPELYWDTFSQEQRIHAICKQLGKVIAYADMLGVNTDDIAARLKAIEDGQLDDLIVSEIEAWFEENEPAIITAIETLNEALPIADFDSENTVKDAIDDINEQISTTIADLSNLLPASQFTTTNTVKKAIDDVGALLPTSAFTTTDTVDKRFDDLEALLPANSFSSVNTVNAALSAVEAEIAASQPTVNVIEDTTVDNQEIFPFPENLDKTDVLQKNYANIITVKEDLSLASAIAAGLQSTLNVNGNTDFCEAITIFNGYMKNANSLTYGNAFTGTTYEGTFDNPVLCNPAEHLINGKMPIDCNTLTTLIGNGVTYDSSTYNGGSNAAMHEMYCPTALTTKAYWWWAPHEHNIERTMGFGRLLTDGFAKMLYDAGELTILQGFTENIQPGDILFSGTATNRFLGITHSSICVGLVNNTMAGTVMGESVNTNYPVRSIPLSNLTLGNYVAKVTPNWNAGIKLTKRGTTYQKIETLKNQNLNGNSYTHTNLNTATSEPLVLVNNKSSNSSISFSASNTDGYTISTNMTVPAKGFSVSYLPYGWTYTLTASANTDLHICQHAISSDKYLIIPPPD